MKGTQIISNSLGSAVFTSVPRQVNRARTIFLTLVPSGLYSALMDCVLSPESDSFHPIRTLDHRALSYRRISLPTWHLHSKDAQLSLDMGQDDCLCRLRREDENGSRVICATLNELDTLLEDTSRTHRPELSRELSKLEAWRSPWDTLTIYEDETGFSDWL